MSTQEAAASTTTADTDPEIRTPALHHVTLKTVRLQEMIDWYATVIGARVNFQWPGGVFLTVDEANHRIAMLTLPTLVEPEDRVAHIGMHHSAFEYPQLDDLVQTYERLKAIGILPHIAIDHGLTLSYYYLDPDGNSVELQADNYGDWAASTKFMREDPRFVADPSGTLIDPEAIAAERRAGTPADVIHERAYAGEFPPTGPVDMRVPLPES